MPAGGLDSGLDRGAISWGFSVICQQRLLVSGRTTGAWSAQCSRRP